MSIEFKIPELGENVASGTVAKVLVAPGDAVAAEQPLLELETDKAVVEIPAPQAGVIREVKVAEGDEAKVGQVVLIMDAGEAESPAEPQSAPEKEDVPEVKQSENKLESKPPVVTPKPAPVEAPRQISPVQEKAVSVPPVGPRDIAPAAPSTRRFAREIGIDINAVPGTGPGGRISVDDVKTYAKRLNQQKAGGAGLPGIRMEELPDFTRWGAVEAAPMSKVREITARHLSYAWVTTPHVTQFDKADITELEKLRREFGGSIADAGGKLTVTAILVKIIAAALNRFPQFNASVDMQNNQIIYKKYTNIGVAVDTDRGLLVPVIRDVDQKNLTQISVELSELAAKARTKKLSPDDLQGGNFSISNLGGIGGTNFTPVVNSPEVAILGVARAKVEPVFGDGEFESRLMLPLALSYDHRVIDGADGARFIRWIVEALEQPFKLLVDG